MSWAVSHRTGTAGELHALELPSPARREVWFLQPARPALVLGSAQAASVVGAGTAASSTGVEVVRRRSGGGAVLLVPGAVLWVDVILPAGDPLWLDDVGRASYWLGEVWVAALASLGVGGAVVHRGALVRNDWSGLVCFAGLGPGEVTVAGRKVVGISQRRTRAAARFQCVVLSEWDPTALVDLLAPSVLPASTVPASVIDAAAGPRVALPALAAAFEAHLPP